MSKSKGKEEDVEEGDRINELIDQARFCVESRLQNLPFRGFNFAFSDVTPPDAALNGRLDFLEVRDRVDDGGKPSDSGDSRQRGMFAKSDIDAGTNLVVARPIAIYWDAEDEGQDSDAGDGVGDDGEDESEGENSEISAGIEEIDDEEGDLVAGLPDGKVEDVDVDPEEELPTGARNNGLLVLRLLDRIEERPSLWTETLSELFPRDAESALRLPPWFCADPGVGMEIERRTRRLSSLGLFSDEANQEICEAIVLRIPLIVRYNVLSVETCPELFVYPDPKEGGMVPLAGTGLYGPEVSYFNHSCAPNVSRYCIGDLMFLVTNRDVAKGDELCFSYIEHELLCESAARRSKLLDMDFRLGDKSDGDAGERPSKKQKSSNMQSKEERDDAVDFPLVDVEMQSELMATPSAERLGLINELLDHKSEPSAKFHCDEYQLRILKAITLEGIGRSNKHRNDKKLGLENALPQWEEAIDFAERNFPPLDETTIALHAQAALCASVNAFRDWEKLALQTKGQRVGDNERAVYHARRALEMHDQLFGGGRRRFLRRYAVEFLHAPKVRSISEAQLFFNLEDLWGFTDEMWDEMSEAQEKYSNIPCSEYFPT